MVQIKDGLPYVTLRCGNMLIDNENLSNKEVPVYEITEWSEKKATDEDDERIFYNCMDGGKEVFDSYYEELYFVYQVNKKYGTDAYFANNVNSCEVVQKTMYRTKTVVDEKKK